MASSNGYGSPGGTLSDGSWLSVPAEVDPSASATTDESLAQLIALRGSGGVSDGDKGDITVSVSGSQWDIDAGAVTLAKMANIASDRLVGRDTAGAGVPEALTVGGGIEFTGSGGIQRSALSGDISAAAGSGVTAIGTAKVTSAMLRDSAAVSVIGRSANSIGVPADIVAGADGDVLRRSAGAVGFGSIPSTSVSGLITPRRVVGVTFDGNGSTPTVGSVGYVVVPFNGTIDQWHIVANASGSAVVDVWKKAGGIPGDPERIAGTEKPTLSAAQLNSDTSLTTWSTTAVTAGDVFGFELESVATCTRITVEVRISESA